MESDEQHYRDAPGNLYVRRVYKGSALGGGADELVLAGPDGLYRLRINIEKEAVTDRTLIILLCRFWNHLNF